MILKKGCITCWCGWKVILGGNDTRNHKQQVLLTEGKLQARVVQAVSRYILFNINMEMVQ
jgi:hypothetical protein